MTTIEAVLMSISIMNTVATLYVLHLLLNVKITIRLIPPDKLDKPAQSKVDGIDMGHKYFS